MSEHTKITASHRVRVAVVYVRQSTPTQLERNGESTARQYDLRERAVALGWPRDQVRVVDADLGVSGSVLGQRDGFEALVADIAFLTPDQPDRQPDAQLTAGGLVADPAIEAGPQHMQFSLAERAFHPQQHPVIEQARVVDAVSVGDQRVTRTGQIQ